MLLREAGGRDAREAAAVGPPTLLPAATAALPMLASLLPWLDEREMGDFFRGRDIFFREREMGDERLDLFMG